MHVIIHFIIIFVHEISTANSFIIRDQPNRHGIKAWINKLIHVRECGVITHPCPNFIGGLVKPPLDAVTYPCPQITHTWWLSPTQCTEQPKIIHTLCVLPCFVCLSHSYECLKCHLSNPEEYGRMSFNERISKVWRLTSWNNVIVVTNILTRIDRKKHCLFVIKNLAREQCDPPPLRWHLRRPALLGLVEPHLSRRRAPARGYRQVVQWRYHWWGYGRLLGVTDFASSMQRNSWY